MHSLIVSCKKDYDARHIVGVPYSKSISNRLLIIKYLSKTKGEITSLSSADDTTLLKNFLLQVIHKTSDYFNCKNAGTTLRFLLSVLAITEGKWFIDADKRMQFRPILPLIDILNSLGADIKIADKENLFPITIIGKQLKTDKDIVIDNYLTSQIISSLLLISPKINGNLTLVLSHNQPSMPYINMTIALVNRFKGKIERKNNTIICHQSEYNFTNLQVEGDYSAASIFYLFEMVGKYKNLQINNIKKSNLQADAIVEKLFNFLGVQTIHSDNSILLSYNESLNKKFDLENTPAIEFNINDTPDLFPALAVALFLNNRRAVIIGIETLKVKESNRLISIQNELNKIEKRCYIKEKEFIIEKSKQENFPNNLCDKSFVFQTYNDHRIAMALSAFAIVCKQITINNSDCVEKSFPDFWQQCSTFFNYLSSDIPKERII